LKRGREAKRDTRSNGQRLNDVAYRFTGVDLSYLQNSPILRSQFAGSNR
jgi:hypothetical protein